MNKNTYIILLCAGLNMALWGAPFTGGFMAGVALACLAIRNPKPAIE